MLQPIPRHLIRLRTCDSIGQQTIAAVESQRFAPLESIVIDDGTADASELGAAVPGYRKIPNHFRLKPAAV